MKRLYIILLCFALCLTSCMKGIDKSGLNEAIKEHSENALGFMFDQNHDWSSTVTDNVTINVSDINDISSVKLVALSYDEETNPVLTTINETMDIENGLAKMNYDVPKDCEKILAIIYTNTGNAIYRNVNYNVSKTRQENVVLDIHVPSIVPEISNKEASYAQTRKYEGFDNDFLYSIKDEESMIMECEDYDEVFSGIMRTIIFNYLPNGRKYNNLPQIKESGYYNEDCYAITTGDKPIIVSPIYKNDGGYHEVETCDLYYYYFQGTPTVDEIKSLPKYKAIQLNRSLLGDNVLKKHHSYALMYFGDGIPETGTQGTYNFPSGYKIGFMIRSKFKDNVKKGELYFDGRLNTDINKHGHFKSSKLGDTDPRMAWLSVNEKMLLCCEAGTDADFNDVIFEVEGGIKKIIVIPPYKETSYIFCFEDTRFGDYDLNDVVIKGVRKSDTKVQWTLMACGANDRLFIYNINGKKIKDDIEVHDIFKSSGFINTDKSKETLDYITETVNVSKDFSFTNRDNMPYILNQTKGYYVHISEAGEDPHAIMIPYDFRWPLETVRINNAYLTFNNWGANKVVSTDWYKFPILTNIW